MFKFTIIILFCFLNLFSQGSGTTVATIRQIEGKAFVMRNSSQQWRDAKANLQVFQKDKLKTLEDAFAEIVFENGEIIRMDEKTELVINNVTSSGARSTLPAGRIWVNMKKILSSRTFDVATPTAVAAIRGTIYSMTAALDSSADLSVFEGKVDFGPTENFQKRLESGGQNTTSSFQTSEKSGPVEIPGPGEVTLLQWQSITAGLRIKVSSNGVYLKSPIPENSGDSFLLRNKKLDLQIK